MHLIFHVTSPGHLIEGSCEFTGGSSLRYVTILINLVTVIIVIVEIFCHVASREHMFKR